MLTAIYIYDNKKHREAYIDLMQYVSQLLASSRRMMDTYEYYVLAQLNYRDDLENGRPLPPDESSRLKETKRAFEQARREYTEIYLQCYVRDCTSGLGFHLKRIDKWLVRYNRIHISDVDTKSKRDIFYQRIRRVNRVSAKLHGLMAEYVKEENSQYVKTTFQKLSSIVEK